MSEPSYEELKAKLAALEEKVKTRATSAIDFKVSEKGGVSVYGLGRFPVTLYYEQWVRLLDQTDAAARVPGREQAEPEVEGRGRGYCKIPAHRLAARAVEWGTPALSTARSIGTVCW